MSTRFSNPQTAVAAGDVSSAAKYNSTIAACFTALNLLDDDIIAHASRLTALESGTYTISGNKTLTDVQRLGIATGTATIATGAIGTPTTTMVTVDTEAAAATDDLDTITAPTKNYFLILNTANNARDVVVKHGTGNLELRNGADCTLANVRDSIFLVYDLTINKWREVARTNDPANVVPKAYIGGPAPKYTSAATCTFPSGMCAMDSTNAVLMTLAADVVPSLASAGAAGLDTGSEASNTWYYAYMIMKADLTTSIVWSVTNEKVSGSITLPSGYIYKRQLPLAIRNDGSSNIIPFDVLGWARMPFIKYRTSMSNHSGGATTAGTTNVLSAGTSATYAAVSCTSFIPPISVIGQFNALATFANSAYITLRNAASGLEIMCGGSAGVATTVDCGCPSQSLDYKRAAGSGSVSLDVVGYYVTEIF